MQAGETLTATTDGIEDEDGLTGAVFAYQWVRSGADIEGAASSTYTMTGDDEGKPIQVRVTFTDDAGNAESLTSYAVLSVPPLIIPDEEPPPESTATREAQGEQESAETPLTAAIHDAPESHDGQEDFTFELRFSEEPKEGFSDVTLRDHAFTVTRGEVVGARRLDGDSATPNIRWEISVTPDSTADVTVELPITTDCEAQGAICTDDGRALSSPLEFTVKGPPLTASFESVPTPHTGSGEFRFRIAFSEAPKSGFSYTTMRDHAFTVTGGSVTGARRLVSGKNLRWEIVVSPGLQRGRDDHSARHHGLRRAGGHLRRRRQEAVQPAGDNRQRAGRIGRGRKSGRAACMAGQGRPSRQSAPEQAERHGWSCLPRGPTEADAPLRIDPYGELPGTISPQCFQPIATQSPQCIQRSGRVQDRKAPRRLAFKTLESWNVLPGGERFSPSVPVALDHDEASVGTLDVSRQATCASYCYWANR